MRIHHIALRTGDLPRLAAFYCGVLGLELTRRDSERSLWLRAGETIVMLERAEAGEPAIANGSMEMVAFAITAEERAECMRRLAAGGVDVEAETPFTLYVRDPDGRRVGLSHYPTPQGEGRAAT
jgi:glyoxylase I family protein